MKHKMEISEISSNGIEYQTDNTGYGVAEAWLKEGFRFVFEYWIPWAGTEDEDGVIEPFSALTGEAQKQHEKNWKHSEY